MSKSCLPSLLIIVFFLSGCSENFKVAAPYKSVTLAYGLLDMADTAHYIRIEKGFLDENKSALVMAQNADSLYFPSLIVVVKAIPAANPSAADSIFTLSRVDLNSEGYTKQAGTFAAGPSYAYKFKNLLRADHTYRLVITNPATGEVDSSETPVINDRDPGTFYVQILDPSVYNPGLDIRQSFPNATFSDIFGNYSNYTGVDNPAMYQGVLRFHWIDSNTANQHIVMDSADFGLGTVYPGSNGAYAFNSQISDIYTFLKTAIGPAAPAHVRVLDSCGIIVYAGTQPLINYQQYYQVAGTGLTGSVTEPVYSNIKGINVYGLYAARGVRTGKSYINQKTLDSLNQSSILQAELIQNYMR